MKNAFINLKSIILLVVIACIITSLTTAVIMYNNNKLDNGAVDINNDEALKEFLKVYSSLDDNYYENINKSEMIDSAIAGMLDYLGEDYSTYLNKDETDELANQLSGTYYGIGISITDRNKIYKVYKNTPAMEAGLLENDLILKINDTEITEDYTQQSVASLIKKDMENTLQIQRGEQIMEIKVTPKEINNPLSREVIEQDDKKIGYISIPSFTNTVSTEFRNALEELESMQINALIIDVRGNTGGYLFGATDIAAMFLEKNKTIYSLEEKDSVKAYLDDTDEKRSYPIALLVNGSSASASEILAAALKDSYGAILVGNATFGKGKVQQTKSLEDGSMVKYTTARWLTPSGECIDNVGLFPDYSIPQSEMEQSQSDLQLEKAIEVLKERL